MQFDDLRGKIAIVTGATRAVGIGAAICQALAEQGCDIFFTTYTSYDQAMYGANGDDDAGALQARLRQIGVRVHRLDIDLSKPESADTVLNTTHDTLGAPSILINNAAFSTRDGYDKLTAGQLDAHYAVNVRAMALLSVGFAKRFEAGQGGRIINLTSGQGLGAMPEELAYVASKGAIEAFTRTLAVEVAPLGITVNAIDPGITDTGWMTDALASQLRANMPMGRFGQPADAARLIAFLASDAAQWITGQVIHSRGGA